MRFPLISVLLLALVSVCGAQERSKAPVFRDPSLPIEQRLGDLIGKLTMEEKISQLMMESPAIPRLGIPAYHWWNEGLHGYARSGVATVFPQAIGLAATWDPALMQRIGDVVSTEARAKYNAELAEHGGTRIYHGLTIWSPNINIFRDPRWGRGQETYGEDPYLSGTLAVGFVHGLQGSDPHHLKTVATLKHYAVHSGPESLRHSFNAVPGMGDLWETYLPAFRTGIIQGQALSVMSAYNAVDGVPAPANAYLLNEVLRKQWGFRGAVVGDVDTVADVWSGHKYTKDAAEASAACLKAGNDLCSGESYKALPEALARGLITQKDIDLALSRLLRLRFFLGQFDPPEQVSFSKIGVDQVATEASDQLALEAARKSMVLLKNDGLLPWKREQLHTVAVIGPTADNQSTLLGNYAGKPAKPVTLIEGLRAKLEPLGVKVLHEPAVPLVEGFVKDLALPESALVSGSELKERGLHLEVYDNPGFSGKPVLEKQDIELMRGWNAWTLSGDINVKSANLRWTGAVLAPAEGDYEFVVISTGAISLKLGDQLISREASADWQPARHIIKHHLRKGEACPLVLEFRQGDKTHGHIELRWHPPVRGDAYEAALAAARQADHVVLTLGITPELEGEEMPVKLAGFEGGDRTTLQLPATQRRLLEDVAALGKPVTVVLTTGSALSLDSSKAGAILCAWYYGQEGAAALAEILLGDCNPSGRLPVTFYASDEDLPAFTDYSMRGRTYRYFKGKPLYAFGHGLSYTTFDYSELRMPKGVLSAGQAFKVSVTVRNTGAMAGEEVVQVYISEQGERAERPLRKLVAYQRVHLAVGESRSLEFEVNTGRMAHWDEASKSLLVESTTYTVSVGPSSDVLPLSGTFSIANP
jgi:beta-glucosidase